MQVRKEDVYQRILVSALNEISEYGYHHASMRRIAKNANITVGNIYVYFENKEALFDALITPLLMETHEMIQMLSKEDSIQSVSFDEIAQQITSLYLKHRSQFLILMTMAHGTKYANAKQSIIEAITQRLLSDLFPVLPADHQDPVMALTMSAALIEGLLTIFTHVYDETKIKKSVLSLMELMFFPLVASTKILT